MCHFRAFKEKVCNKVIDLLLESDESLQAKLQELKSPQAKLQELKYMQTEAVLQTFSLDEQKVPD